MSTPTLYGNMLQQLQSQMLSGISHLTPPLITMVRDIATQLDGTVNTHITPAGCLYITITTAPYQRISALFRTLRHYCDDVLADYDPRVSTYRATARLAQHHVIICAESRARFIQETNHA